MRALTWQGRDHVEVADVPEPEIHAPTDAVIRVTSTAICGSDLHLYHVFGPFLRKGDILGHEFMGIVEQVGGDTGDLQVGDRVVIPFNIACGRCFMCHRGLQSQCETTQVTDHGKGAALFGYTTLYGAVPGGQAEKVRVPHAGYGAVRIPHEGSDERYLYLSDVLPTAWQAAQYADIEPGGTVAVIGLGPIGQMSARCAGQLGAGRVIGVDLVDERLERARQSGVETIDLRSVKDVAAEVLRMTDGRGADSVIDAVGLEAHGNPVAERVIAATTLLPDPVARRTFETMGIDRLAALHTAIGAVRRGGTLSISGVYTGMADPMPMLELFDKQVTIRMGQANVRRWTDELLAMVQQDGDLLGVEGFATHHLPLEEAPHAYEMFQKKLDGCQKVVLHP